MMTEFLLLAVRYALVVSACLFLAYIFVAWHYEIRLEKRPKRHRARRSIIDRLAPVAHAEGYWNAFYRDHEELRARDADRRARL